MEKSKVLIQFFKYQIKPRNFSTSSVLEGKRNFRKFLLYNKRGTNSFKKAQSSENPLLPVDKRGVRDTGFIVNGKYIEVPEKIPHIIVPDLDGCTLRPYVSYKTPEVVQSEFTSFDLFNAVYSKKIIEDFKTGKLNEAGEPLEPSEEERMTKDEAWIKARKTGSDIF